jgi:hypothetical protein
MGDNQNSRAYKELDARQIAEVSRDMGPICIFASRSR